ncbi:MAG: hypothetical protein VYA17_11475 [Pseudomonadota bacterium]|nr:hypothetical protein [Pseudomonadota bacterium]
MEASEAQTSGSQSEQGSMPRIGQSGTITREQIKLLKESDFEPSRLWSKEEAQLILDTVTYLRSVIYIVTNEDDPPIEVQNNVLKFILTDDSLREHVYEWGLNRPRDESAMLSQNLERDDCFEQVKMAVLEQWEAQ